MAKTVVAILTIAVLLSGGLYLIFSDNLLNNNQSASPESAMPTIENGGVNEIVDFEYESETPAPNQGSVKEFTITGKSFSFTPSAINVKKGDTVKITLVNTGGFHDLVIDEFNVATKRINNGESETIQFVADKTGTFEYYCSVGTHRQMGMVGALTVE
jgi:plastocyanin